MSIRPFLTTDLSIHLGRPLISAPQISCLSFKGRIPIKRLKAFSTFVVMVATLSDRDDLVRRVLSQRRIELRETSGHHAFHGVFRNHLSFAALLKGAFGQTAF